MLIVAIVNYTNLSVLIRNMPLEDRDRYGRMKDLIPVLMSAADVKINAIKAERATANLSEEVLGRFGVIRSQLFHLVKTLVDNQEKSTVTLEHMVTELNTDLLRMGLDEDQEAYLLRHLDNTIAGVAEQLDSRAMLHEVFRGVLDNLKEISGKQEELHNVFVEMNRVDQAPPPEEDDVELF